MWYVKDETGKIYFKSKDIREAQKFAVSYNKTHKIPGTKIIIGDFNEFFGGYWLSNYKWDINWGIFNKTKLLKSVVENPFNKKFEQQHDKYCDKKLKLLNKLGKKYHLWSYNSEGRKANGFDF